MADSENSRTLPANTRLNILSYTTDFLARVQDRDGSGADADPALAKWLEWHEAHREFELSCRLQQHLETQLVEAVGFPMVKIEVPGTLEPVVIQNEADIEYWLEGPDNEEARDRAKEKLSVQLRRWSAADQVMGYTRAREAERVAADRELALAAELWDMPAQSIEGMIAKLQAVLTLGIASPECDEFPWPALRSVMNDLIEMVKSLSELATSDKAQTPILEVAAVRARQR